MELAASDDVNQSEIARITLVQCDDIRKTEYLLDFLSNTCNCDINCSMIDLEWSTWMNDKIKFLVMIVSNLKLSRDLCRVGKSFDSAIAQLLPSHLCHAYKLSEIPAHIFPTVLSFITV